MIRAAVGVSTHVDPARCALEAAGQIAQQLDGVSPDWCIAFATYAEPSQLSAMLSTLSEAVGTPYVTGCSGAGILAGGSEIEEGPALGVLAVASSADRAAFVRAAVLPARDGSSTGGRLRACARTRRVAAP